MSLTDKWRNAMERIRREDVCQIADEPDLKDYPLVWVAELLLVLSLAQERLRYSRTLNPKWLDVLIPAIEETLERAREQRGKHTGRSK